MPTRPLLRLPAEMLGSTGENDRFAWLVTNVTKNITDTINGHRNFMEWSLEANDYDILGSQPFLDQLAASLNQKLATESFRLQGPTPLRHPLFTTTIQGKTHTILFGLRQTPTPVTYARTGALDTKVTISINPTPVSFSFCIVM